MSISSDFCAEISLRAMCTWYYCQSFIGDNGDINGNSEINSGILQPLNGDIIIVAVTIIICINIITTTTTIFLTIIIITTFTASIKSPLSLPSPSLPYHRSHLRYHPMSTTITLITLIFITAITESSQYQQTYLFCHSKSIYSASTMSQILFKVLMIKQ